MCSLEEQKGGGEMQEKEVKEIADWIIAGLVSRGVTISEAVKALRMADRRIRTARAEMFEETNRTPITEALKEKNGYSSPIGNSAKCKVHLPHRNSGKP